MGPISAIDILYGFRPSLQKGNHYMAHKIGFTKDVLQATLINSGFKSAVVASIASRYVLWAIATKDKVEDTNLLFDTLKKHTTLLS